LFFYLFKKYYITCEVNSLYCLVSLKYQTNIMATPTPQSAYFDFDITIPVPGGYASSPRTPTNDDIPFVIPNAPKKNMLSVPRRGIEGQLPVGYVYHPILQRRGLPPIRKIVF
jgi:hypothetical protein